MKYALVTGATRGIGKATTELLIANGYFVYGLYQTSKEAAQKFETSHKDHCTFFQADVSSHQAVEKVLQHIPSLDVLVNNAGINLWGAIEKFSVEDWDRMMAVNVRSIFILSKLAVPLLRKGKNPCIINITSRLGEKDFIEPEFVPYSVTKAAVTAFTIGLSKELVADTIRVNAVVPPPTKTDLFDQVFTKEDEDELLREHKLAKPEEVAELIFHAIEDTSLNGEIIFDSRVK
jgi:3-oxoacyl-[acyl-carrier protein] reductase